MTIDFCIFISAVYTVVVCSTVEQSFIFIIIIIIYNFYTLGIKDPEGFGKK